jgi:3-oxoacyl-[acyl-carrier protein] reductase
MPLRLVIETEMTAKLEDVVKDGEKNSVNAAEPARRRCQCLRFLASDLSAYVTGQVINVCGEKSM